MDQSIVEKVRDSYNLAAEDYNKNWFNELAYKPFDRSILFRFYQMTKELGMVCDMGCGPGEVADFLYKCGSRVMGMDISPEMIKQAQKNNPGI